MNKTLTYSEEAQGWPSFYSFIPDFMIGMNNYFYSFKGGNLYRHNTNETRNNFYGVQYTSTIRTVINSSPLENKLFKTVCIEGDDAWEVDLYTDIQDGGNISYAWFDKKEQTWFAFIRNTGTEPASPSEYPLRSVSGIGNSLTITGVVASTNVNFPITVSIGSTLSIGDTLYYALPPYTTPVLFGDVIGIDVDLKNGINRVVVDATGGSVPGIQTPFIMFIKNQIAESHGLLGHYCVVDMTSTKTNKIELFTVGSDVMKSYP